MIFPLDSAETTPWEYHHGVYMDLGGLQVTNN